MTSQALQELLDHYHAAQARGKRSVLATIIQVTGSAYRREGAKMIISEDGLSACMISSGCLEQDMIEAGLNVLITGKPERVIFEHTDEKVWWPGCGGTVEVWLEPLDPDSLLLAYLKACSHNRGGTLVSAISGASGRLWFTPDQGILGQITPDEVQAKVVRAVQSATRLPNGLRFIQDAEVLIDTSPSPRELVLFGAGFDAVPLAEIADRVGYHVTVVDARAHLATPEQFPQATRLHLHPEVFSTALDLPPEPHLILMNHHLELDQACLQYALSTDAPYIGILGPSSRLKRMLDNLVAQGFTPTPEQHARLRNPIGLDIGAEGAQEIAVAVVAGLLAFERGFAGGFLKDKTAGIHERKSG